MNQIPVFIIAPAGEELVSQLELMTSQVCFFGEMQKYNKSRGKVHLKEDQSVQGVDLHEENWIVIEEHLSHLSGKSKSIPTMQKKLVLMQPN